MERTLRQLLESPEDFGRWFEHALISTIVMIAICETRALHHLGDEPLKTEELAARAGLPTPELHRLLVYLTVQGLLERDDEGRFRHTDLSRMLQPDHPMSLLPSMFASSMSLEVGLSLGEALRRRENPHVVRYGKDIFERMGELPGEAELFGRFMAQTTVLAEQFIFERHMFAPFELAVDVGGSQGALLRRLLADRPAARGILFDLPAVVEQAPSPDEAGDAAGRIELVGGDFFASVPAGGDLYLLKQILHDWDDDQCIAILRNVRRAIAPGGRLAVIDRVIPEAMTPHSAFEYDIFMMLLTNGRERRRSDFEALFAASGFQLDTLSDNPAGPSVIEAVPV